MTTFNPRDWPRLPDWLDPHQGRRSPREINREVLERCRMALAFFAVRRPRAPETCCPLRSPVCCFWPGSPLSAWRLCAGISRWHRT